MSIITKGLITSGLGLAGVFVTLILFYILTKAITAVAVKAEKKDVVEVKQ
jgi:Na+-transporting methylmalonyl-CoA/oxaloacetate decarboxylase gamma subunit